MEKTTLGPNFKYGCCPVCKCSWDGGSIFDTFIEQRNQGYAHLKGKSDDEIREQIEGWTQEKINIYLDSVTDDELMSALRAFFSKAYSSNWVQKNYKKISLDMPIAQIRDNLKKLEGKELDIFLYDGFRVDILGSYSPPYRWSKIVGLETGEYDGVRYWVCPECNSSWSAFTLEEYERKEKKQ